MSWMRCQAVALGSMLFRHGGNLQAFIEIPREKKRRKQNGREEKKREKKCRLDKSEAVISVQGDDHQSINQSIKHTYLTHMIHNIAL